MPIALVQSLAKFQEKNKPESFLFSNEKIVWSKLLVYNFSCTLVKTKTNTQMYLVIMAWY